ncbi:MAG TPA: MFS transporter [Aliiroseovarius sp.]|nr:MFS transporter [Aliiroseovarius sp.]
MSEPSARKRIWGWFFFDWASQPYNTLLLTFIFGPYFGDVVRNYLIGTGMEAEAAKAQAQSIWGLGLTVAGLVIAFSAPVLGAMADAAGRRMPWIWFFSALYVIGSAALWFTWPDASNYKLMLVMFGIGFIGMEFTTIFTNALLPDLGTKEEIGQISGSGFAFGYWGGFVALLIMLLFFAENADGKTLLGIAPLFGLDPAMREGTRFVGPFSALWYVIFMVVFFRWVKEPPRRARGRVSLGAALAELGQTLRSLSRRTSLFAYLGSSLFYRDALNGLYTFGGIYALNVLGWSITQVGVFGIVGILSAAVFAWIGGRADRARGPKPVIVFCIVTLILVTIVIVSMTRDQIFGLALPEGSALPDIIMYVCGAVIGAAGGALQASSRSMLVRHCDPDHAAEAFGLYALSGKATAFLAPALVSFFSWYTQSPRLGVSPLIGLFVLGLILLAWVNPEGETERHAA